MPSRTPTILGWAGFDGGYRRAVSFARSSNREPDDDPILKLPPGCPNPSVNLEAVYDALVLCGCYEAISGGIRSANISATTGFGGGPVTLIWDGASAWETVIGTVTVDFYTLDSCAGAIDSSQTLDAILRATCGVVGSNVVYSVGVTLDGITAGSSLIFAGSGSIDTPMANTIICGTSVPAVLGAVTPSKA